MEELNIYPIGKFQFPEQFNLVDINNWIQEIENLPYQLQNIIQDLPVECYEYSYKKEGWSINQIIHHLADGHMNAFIRFKLTLTEINPTIKPFDQDLWAQLNDNNLSTFISLQILHGLHKKWVALLKSLHQDQFNRTYFHPDYKKDFSLWVAVSLFAWHGKHHLAQINKAIELKLK